VEVKSQSMKNILITGGSGLVGSRLTEILTQKGYNVAWLGRSKKAGSQVQTFLWDTDFKTIDTAVFEYTDVIINLAGAGVADKRWTPKYKEEIYTSRVNSTRFLVDCLISRPHHVETFINASAAGIYGNHFNEPATEETPSPISFLAKVCRDWEAEADRLTAEGIRTAMIRTGIVLSQNEGFIGKLRTPILCYAGSALGSGQQLISWIHIDDLCDIYLAAVENSHIRGPYNAVAPVPVSNKELTRLLAKQLGRPLIFPNIPVFFLRLALGEMSEMLVGNQPVSARKIQDTGFTFRFEQAEEAIKDLIY
jgi:uncharacterized protein